MRALRIGNPMQNAIEAAHITKTFTLHSYPWQKRKITTVLADINLRIKKGECFALLGPNGAGKTTLIKILCSLILADEGEVTVAGYNLKSQERRARAQIGLVTGRERSFYWRLTGRQNLEFFATMYDLGPGMIKQRIRELTGLLEIEGLDKPFFTYSTGVKQRFSLARCLIHNPGIIFMDEPTRSLDIESANKFRTFVKEKLAGEMGKTIFFVTHQPLEVEELAGRFAVMDKGKIKIRGDLNEIRLKLGLPEQTTVKQAYLKAVREN